MSWLVTTTISVIKIAKPKVFIHLTIFGEIGRPRMASRKTKSSRPPSRAGKGIKFIIAKFIEIKATKEIR